MTMAADCTKTTQFYLNPQRCLVMLRILSTKWR